MNLDGVGAAIILDLGFAWQSAGLFLITPRTVSMGAHYLEEAEQNTTLAARAFGEHQLRTVISASGSLRHQSSGSPGCCDRASLMSKNRGLSEGIAFSSIISGVQPPLACTVLIGIGNP